MKRRTLATLLAALVISGTNTLAAEDSAPTAPVPQTGVMALNNAPEMNLAYGPYDVWTSFGAPQFMPRTNTSPPTYYANGYVYPKAGEDDSFYWAQLLLPNGAEVKYVYMPVYDNDDNGYVQLSLWGAQAAHWTDTSPEFKSYGSANTGTTETPGYINLYVTPSEPLIIHEYADLDGDGDGNTYFWIKVDTARDPATAITDIRFFGAAVNWTRTISPAPATATFNDVPTNHWAFQSIEAMASSGITSGCDASNFCPDDTLTRAQMAVFLARALGLHWGT